MHKNKVLDADILFENGKHVLCILFDNWTGKEIKCNTRQEAIAIAHNEYGIIFDR